MDRPRNIFLVGPMGTGKTTIGKQLAKSLQMEFIDSDQVIEQRTGADITWIFDIEGEEGFRRRETEVLDELTQRSDIVLATGGGAVLAPQNRDYLKRRGQVVYLHTDLDLLVERTAKDRKRPLLQTPDPKARLRQLLEEREPLYRDLADVVLVTSDYTVRGAVKALVNKLVPKPKKRAVSDYNKSNTHTG